MSRVEHIETFDLIAFMKDGGVLTEPPRISNSNLLLVLIYLYHTRTRVSHLSHCPYFADISYVC